MIHIEKSNMTNIAEILLNYCTDNDYYFITETAAGANVMFDKFLASQKDYAVHYNILRTGILNSSASGKHTTISRTVEIIVAKKCTKADLGSNYLPLIDDVEEKVVELYTTVLSNTLNVTNASYETAVDSQDACLVMARLTLTIDDDFGNCF